MSNMWKKILSLVLALSMAVGMVSTAAFAEGEEEAIPMAATLTIEAGKTYTISNLDELKAFKTLVEKGNTFAGSTVELTRNVTMGISWTAIGASVGSWSNRDPDIKAIKAFSGTFDGKGYALKYPTFVFPSYDAYGIGFFAKLDGATVKNLNFTNVTTSASTTSYTDYYYVGAIAGLAVDSTIDNCTVSATEDENGLNCKAAYDLRGFGGLIGTATNCTISNCRNDVEVNNTNGRGSHDVGGIAGYATNCTIRDCTNTGNITAGYTAGGIVGEATRTTIINCLNTGAVTASWEKSTDLNSYSGIGGMVGYAYGSGTVDQCVNEGVLVSNYLYTYGGPSGGIVGLAAGNWTISNCWNKAAVKGVMPAGIVGMCGRHNSGTYYPEYSGAQAPVMIFNCLNTGKITNRKDGDASYGGGIVGYVGSTNGAEVENCFNQGAVLANDGYGRYNGMINSVTSGWSNYSGSLTASKQGNYSLSYVNHSYQYDHAGDATSRWAGGVSYNYATGYNKDNCVKFFISDVDGNDDLKQQYCDDLNGYAAKQTIWHVEDVRPGVTSTLKPEWTPRGVGGTVLVIEETEEPREYAEWIFDSSEKINRGLPYLNLPNVGYSEVPATTYTLTYHANGGDGAPAAQKVDSRTDRAEFTITRVVPKLTGYLFQGWSTAADGDVEYTAGQKLVMEGDTEQTLYAVWEECQHPNTPNYSDNEDGTHDGICPDCGLKVVDDEAHADEDDNGACDDCQAAMCSHEKDVHGNCVVEDCKHTGKDCCPKDLGCVDEKNEQGEAGQDGFCDKCGACMHEKDADGYCTVKHCPHAAAGKDCCVERPHEHEDEDGDGKCDDEDCGACLHEKDEDGYCVHGKDCPHILAGDDCCTARPHEHKDENGDGKCDDEDCGACLHEHENGYCTVEGCTHDESCCVKRPHVHEDNGTGKCDCGVCLHTRDEDGYCNVEGCDHGSGCCPKRPEPEHQHKDEDGDGKCDEDGTCMHDHVDGYCTVEDCDHDESCCVKRPTGDEDHQHKDDDGDGKCDDEDCGTCMHEHVDGYCTVEDCDHDESCCVKRPSDEKHEHKDEDGDGKCDDDNCGACLHEHDADHYCTEEGCTHGTECCVKRPAGEHEHKDEDGDGKCDDDDCGACLHEHKNGYCTLAENCPHIQAGDSCCALHPHTWDEGEVTTDPTCTTEGEKTFVCAGCGATKTEPVAIDPDAHRWGGYVADGAEKHTRTCEYNAEHTESKPHTFGAWEYLPGKKETATQDGEQKRECTVCHYEETKAIPATGDDDDDDDNGGNGGGGGGGMTPTPPVEDLGDEDVPLATAPGLNNTDHFAYIVGFTDGTVRPMANITRSEVVTIFFRLMTEEYREANWSTENEFPDVAADAWYNNAVSTAVKAGLIKGLPDGTFGGTKNITRAEFATIAARFLSEAVNVEKSFDDIGGHWAENDINRAVMAGWIKGVGDNKFNPDAYITRAEVMTLVNRMLNRVADADHMLADMVEWPDNPKGEWYYADVQEATNGHDYQRDELGVTEIWTAITESRDWTELEK